MEIFVGKAEIKSTNVFQPVQLYNELHEWLIEFGYTPSPKDTDFPEKYYWEARTQNAGTESWIWWRPSKTVEGNSFWKSVINIDFHGVGMKPVEIMYKGKKIKCSRGKLEVLLQAKLVLDESRKFENSKFFGSFWGIFTKRLYKQEIETYKKEVLVDLKSIQDIARRFFDLGAFSIDKKPFIPVKGYQDDEF